MVDLKGQYEAIKKEVDVAIQSVIEKTAFINGPEVKEFENDLKNLKQLEKRELTFYHSSLNQKTTKKKINDRGKTREKKRMREINDSAFLRTITCSPFCNKVK